MYSEKEIEMQRINDAQKLALVYKRIGDRLTERSDAEAAGRITEALRDYCDAVFAGDLALWIANLYDYESGGFYYSNSGRDNEGFLPDLESTMQAMGWLFESSIKPTAAKSWQEFYPEWMQKRLLKFIKEKQDPNGYFYHPQWPRELTDSKPHRRGRDLTWACRMLGFLGASPTYDTPTGERGDGLTWDGLAARGFSHRAEEGINAPGEDMVSPHLKDRESFIAYLEGLDLRNRSYPVSNELESQSNQIVERDKVLAAMGADYSLADILVDWFGRNQDPETGLFTFEKPDVESVNGLMKASSTVNRVCRPFPNAKRGIDSAISVIEGDEYMSSVCCVMNPLCTINVLLQNIADYGSDGEETEKYRRYVFDRAPEIIAATKQRILRFKKPDGSFSFSPDHSSVTSQGHPVAIEFTNEGDVNATMIATGPVIGHILEILGVERPPIFGGADVMRFFNVIEKKRTEAECKEKGDL